MASVGRPRNAALDGRILAAAAGLLAERGVRGLRADELAERAGIPKSSIYRRWPSLRHLIVEAMAREVDLGAPNPEGDPVLELRAAASAMGRAFAGRRGRALLELAVEVASDPELADLYRRLLVLPNREIGLALMRRAQAAGDFRPDVDLELALDGAVGAIVYRAVLLGREVSAAEIDGMAEELIARLRAR